MQLRAQTAIEEIKCKHAAEHAALQVRLETESRAHEALKRSLLEQTTSKKGKDGEAHAFDFFLKHFGSDFDVQDVSGKDNSTDILLTHRRTGVKIRVDAKNWKNFVDGRNQLRFDNDVIKLASTGDAHMGILWNVNGGFANGEMSSVRHLPFVDKNGVSRQLPVIYISADSRPSDIKVMVTLALESAARLIEGHVDEDVGGETTRAIELAGWLWERQSEHLQDMALSAKRAIECDAKIVDTLARIPTDRHPRKIPKKRITQDIRSIAAKRQRVNENKVDDDQ
jgi:hypothetical protein